MQLEANQELTGTLPAGFKLTATALSEDATASMQRMWDGAEVKTSHLVADPVPYVFGPFNKDMDVTLACQSGAYAVLTFNDSAGDEAPAPEFSIS